MAQCVIITDENNKVETVLAPNGQKSILFQSILNLENVSNKEEALKLWAQVYTPVFKKWFGDWENDSENSSFIIDQNGEPLLVYRKSNGSITNFNWTTEKQEGQVPFLLNIKNLKETTIDLINSPNKLLKTNGAYIAQTDKKTELLTFEEESSYAIIDSVASEVNIIEDVTSLFPDLDIQELENSTLKQLEKENPEINYKKALPYIVLNFKQSEAFTNYLEKSRGVYPKEWNDDRYEVKYIKSNNYKNSRLYDVIDGRTGEVLKEKVKLFLSDEFLKIDKRQELLDKWGFNVTVPDTYNINRSFSFLLYLHRPGKTKFIAQARKYLYEALKLQDEEDQQTYIDLNMIDDLLSMFPEEIWSYVNAVSSPFLGPKLTAATAITSTSDSLMSLHNVREVPKLGLIKALEKEFNIKLNNVSFINYDRSGALGKIKLEWGKEVIINNKHTRKNLIKILSYYLKTQDKIGNSSEQSNIEHYALDKNIPVEDVLETLEGKGFSTSQTQVEINSFRKEGFGNTMAYADWKEHVYNYNWQFKKAIESINKNYRIEYIKYLQNKFKDEILPNGQSYLDYFFNYDNSWLKIIFNSAENIFYENTEFGPEHVHTEVEINPVTGWIENRSPYGFTTQEHVAKRVEAIMHEPFHALHALTYGTEEEIEMRKAYDEFRDTHFGNHIIESLFGQNDVTFYSNANENEKYIETVAHLFTLMNTPKNLRTEGRRDVEIEKFIEQLRNINKTFKTTTTETKTTTTSREEEIKLNFLQKLYNLFVKALNTAIPITKKWMNLIKDSKIINEETVEIVEKTKYVKDETYESKKIEFFNALDNLKSTMDVLLSVDGSTFSSKNVKNFFKGAKDIQALANEKTSIVVDNALLGARVIKLDTSSQKNQVAKETIEVLNNELNRLSDKFGITSNIISHDEAIELTKDSYNPYTGQSSSFFYNGKIYFVDNMLNTEQILHEFSHPFISAIRKSNPALYEKLLADALKTEEGQQALKEAQEEYKNIPDEYSYAINDEVLVKMLTKATAKEKTKIDNKKFDSVIQRIIYAIKKILKDIFGKKIKVQDLSVDTTILDLAKIMNSSDKVDINEEIISDKDIVQYLQDISEEIAELEKVPFKDLSDMINSNYDLLTNHIREFYENKDFKGLKNMLNPKEGGGIYSDMQNRIRKYQTIDEFIENEENVMNEISFHHEMIKSSIYNLQKINKLTTIIKDNLKIIQQEPNNKENLLEASRNWFILKSWKAQLKDFYDTLSNYIDPNTKIMKAISDSQSVINYSENIIDSIFEKGIVDVLTESWETVNNRLIEIWDERRKKLIKEKAKNSQIERERKMHEESLIDKEKMKNFLKGKYGDMNALMGFIEGYMFSEDPVVGSFGLWVRNNMHDVMDNAYKRSIEMATVLKAYLAKAGYNKYNVTNFWREYLFKDSVVGERDKDGNLTEKQVWTFLNMHKNHRYAIRKMKENVTNLYEEYQDENDEEIYNKYHEALLNYNKHKRVFFNQPFVDEYYEAYKLFDTPVGSIAKQMYDESLRAISEKKDEIGDNEYDMYDHMLQNQDLKQLLREHRLLFSEYGKDALGVEIAKILKNFKKRQSKFKDSILIPDAFDIAYNNFKTLLHQKLIEENYSQETDNIAFENEFNKRLDEWIEQNTIKEIKQEWWEKRKILFENLASITSNLPISETFEINDDLKKNHPVLYEYVINNNIEKGSYSYGEYIKDLYDKINDILSPYKDINGIVEASDLTIKQLEYVKDLQIQISDLREELGSSTGLNKEERDRYKSYWDIINRYKIPGKYVSHKNILTEDQYKDFQDLGNKKSQIGLNKVQKDLLNKIFSALEEIQTKKVSVYYLDQLNHIINNEQLIPILNTSMVITGGEITESNINEFLSSGGLIDNLLKNEGFKEWFDLNHFEKIYNEDGIETVIYTPIQPWLQTIPTDDNFYKTTDLYENGIKERTIIGSPSYQYKNPIVKEKYQTKKIEGETWSSEIGWLPKSYEQMQEIAKNNPDLIDPYRYINMDYINLRKTNNDTFKLLEKIKELHLENQQGLHRRSRLGYDIPRYRMSNIDIAEGIRHQGIMAYVNEVKSNWLKRKDDFEENFSAQDKAILLSMDMFDDEVSKIPIRGKYDIETNEVSLDVLYSMDRYNQAAERQKKLITMSPFARSLEKTLDVKENYPDEVLGRFDKGLFKRIKNLKSSFKRKKSTKDVKNKRREHLKHFIKREFEGQMFSEGHWADSKYGASVVKVTSNLAKVASWSFFAFNIPSALKNRYGAMFQGTIEASANKYFNPMDWTHGRKWSLWAQSKLSFGGNLYSATDIPLEMRLMDHFEAIPGYSSEKFTTRHSRTILTDIASGSWAYSHRKFLENGATLQQFGAMMHNIKVPKVDKNGNIIKINGITQTVPYLYAFEKSEDGENIKLKEGLHPDYEIGEKKFKEMKNRIRTVIMKLQGAYALEDQPYGNQYFLFRMAMFMRKYFPPMMIAERFRGVEQRYEDPDHVFGKSWKGRYEPGTGELVLGRYLHFTRSVVGSLKYNVPVEERNTGFFGKMGDVLGSTIGLHNKVDAGMPIKLVKKIMGSNEFALLPTEQKRATAKVLMEFALLYAVTMLYSIAGFDDDDEDKGAQWKKVKSLSGPLPVPGVVEDPENPFNFEGFLRQHALLLLMNIRAENEQFIPLPTHGLSDLSKMRDNMFIVLSPSFDMVIKMLSNLDRSKDDFYQKDTGGPYSWQKEGSWKIWNDIGKMLGLTGQSVSPGSGAEKFQRYRQQARKR